LHNASYVLTAKPSTFNYLFLRIFRARLFDGQHSWFKWCLQVSDDSSGSDCRHRYCYHRSTGLVHRWENRTQQWFVHCVDRHL